MKLSIIQEIREKNCGILWGVLLCFFLFPFSGSAQLVLSGVDSPNKTVTASSSIRMTTGFRVTAASGTRYHAFIDSNGDGIPDLPPPPPPVFSGENYIKTTEYLTETGEGGDKKVSIVYFDGLGREKQTVRVAASLSGKDVLTHYEYDKLGRRVKDFLPVPSSNSNGNLISDPSSLYTQYYGQNYGTSYFYAEKELENSPLRRVLKQAAPGDTWRMGGGHEVKNEYQLNESGEVRRFKVNLGQNYEPSLVDLGFYPSATVNKTITKDENWTTGNNHTLEEFKNTEGKTLLRRTYNSERHDTYYIYDIYGNLTYVLPPMLSDKTVITRELLDELGYQYKYDEENRLVEKKNPGKGWEYLVYDKQDRVVLVQDSEQRKKNRWLFVKYDKFSRVVYTGYIVNTSSRSSLQANAFSRGVNNEEISATGFTVGGLKVYYDNKTAIPNGITEVLTVNYYDTYQNTGAPQVTSIEGQAVLSFTDSRLKGALTASYSKLLDGNAQGKGNWTYTWYDAKIRPIRSRTQNFLGGFTQVDSKLDKFRGRTDYTLTTHNRAAQTPVLTIKETFTYDSQERLLTHTHQVNGGTEEYLTQNQYNELGQLKNKKVGGQVRNSGLQQVDYKYNIRGWLTNINDINNLNPSGQPQDLFSFKLSYEKLFDNIYNQISPQYNGNISETYWRTSSDHILREYSYAYDSMNRLTDAFYNKPEDPSPFQGRYNERFITYDKNGNIQKLLRLGLSDLNLTGMDHLYYTYKPNSNQLVSVKDISNEPAGFTDWNTTGDDYAYDSNGNMIQDLNKGITSISYNYLNLPEKITSSEGSIEYLYDAGGSKLQKKVTGNAGVITTLYLGGFQYEENILQFFPQAEGYVKKENNQYSYVYNYVDNVGNIRLSYRQDSSTGNLVTLEENHYYPFGMKHSGYANINNQPEYKYKYNGQELQDELGLNVTAMDFRQYDMALGRFTGMDALSAYNPGNSPYAFALNNPVFWSDPSGLWHAIYDANYNLIGYGSDGAGDVQDFFKDNSGNFNQNIDYFVNYIVNYEAVHFNIEPITVTAKNPAAIANTIYNIAQKVVTEFNKNQSSFHLYKKDIVEDNELSMFRTSWNWVADNIISSPIEGVQVLGYIFKGGFYDIPKKALETGRFEHLHINTDISVFKFKNGSLMKEIYKDDNSMADNQKFDAFVTPSVNALTLPVGFKFKPTSNPISNFGFNFGVKLGVKKGLEKVTKPNNEK